MTRAVRLLLEMISERLAGLTAAVRTGSAPTTGDVPPAGRMVRGATGA